VSRKILLSATINGIAITLLTGLIPNRTTMLVGADYYGYPFPWLIRLVLAPQYFPWRVNLLFLIADIVAWALISVVVLLIIAHRRRTMKTRLESEKMRFRDPMETLQVWHQPSRLLVDAIPCRRSQLWSKPSEHHWHAEWDLSFGGGRGEPRHSLALRRRKVLGVSFFLPTYIPYLKYS
jgi:hypothetical protein